MLQVLPTFVLPSISSSKMLLLGVLLVGVTACQDTANHSSSAEQPSSTDHPAEASKPLPQNPLPASAVDIPVIASTTSKAAQKTPKAIDWQLIATNEPAVDPAVFNYPFALDSQPVKAYSEMYQVDAKTARYNLTVGMAVNEVLSKLLDQLGTAYVSHELTAGKQSKFIVHTTQAIMPSEQRYIFTEPFAKGLSILVVIKNDGVKATGNTHPHTTHSLSTP